MQEEIENKTVTLSVNTTKMTASVLKSALSKYLAYQKERARDKKLAKSAKLRDGPVKPRGKQRCGTAQRKPDAAEPSCCRLNDQKKNGCGDPQNDRTFQKQHLLRAFLLSQVYHNLPPPSICACKKTVNTLYFYALKM